MRPLDECLLKKKTGSIVTDGLVLWIDGRDEPYNNVHVVDRVSGNYCYCTKSSSTLISSDKFYKLTSNATTAFKFFTPSPSLNTQGELMSGIKTIEFVGGVDEASGGVEILASSRSSDNGLVYRTISAFLARSASKYAYIEGRNGHCVFTSTGMFVNGQWYSCKIPIASVAWLFNCRSFSSATRNYYIGCQRLYDRELTEEEIMQNYNYEKSLGRVD